MASLSPAHQKFERTLAWHCAPALIGIKAADMICWKPPSQDTADFLQYYTETLARLGICLHVLLPRGGRLLTLVFRPESLKQRLSQPDVRAALKRDGYPIGEVSDPILLLNYLRYRLGQADFPHEIGLFLGYPVADVEGFRIYGGRSSKLSGCWKVYGDTDYAQQMFARFLHCRQALTVQMEKGQRLEQILLHMPPHPLDTPPGVW